MRNLLQHLRYHSTAEIVDIHDLGDTMRIALRSGTANATLLCRKTKHPQLPDIFVLVDGETVSIGGRNVADETQPANNIIDVFLGELYTRSQ